MVIPVNKYALSGDLLSAHPKLGRREASNTPIYQQDRRMGGGGMVREVDRAIGAFSTLVIGVGILVLREFLKSDKDGLNRWERYELGDDGKDIYYQKKYGAPKMPLFQHRGSCDCGALRFFILAPKRVEAFDDSNAVSCKKGRFPYLVLPTSCFEMVEAANVSVYEPEATTTQHTFCSNCGVHIFHFDQAHEEVIAVNLYCIDDDNFEDVKIIFVPKGAKPMFGTPRRFPLAVEQAAYRPLSDAVIHEPARDDQETSTINFQKQMMLWARMDKHRHSEMTGGSDDMSTTSSSSHRHSFAAEDPVRLMDMKEQLQYYLKRHLDEEPSVADNQAHV